jgi:NAD(P)H-hydrate epimerase
MKTAIPLVALPDCAVLSVAQSGEADCLAASHGVPTIDLMERAGAAVADAVLARWGVCRVVVLCGPGNNGGDGFVTARHLAQHGVDVSLSLLGAREKMRGDAAEMAARWTGPIVPLSPDPGEADIYVDALFGAGLARPTQGVAAEAIAVLDRAGKPVVAVDLPSGLHGDTGQVLGAAPRATLTVTFFRPKPAHLLMPGRALCGETLVADIGIPDTVLADIAPDTFADRPALWLDAYPWPRAEGHKYSRGHAVVVGGDHSHTGAARLAARAALRLGAGLVTVASPPDALAVNAAQLTAIMLRPFAGADGLVAFLSDLRLNAVLAGPGIGVGKETRDLVRAALEGRRAVVLDADAITSFAEDPDALFGMLSDRVVLTPHEGEFVRLFPDLADTTHGKPERVRAAARRSGTIVLLKGPDTVIAAPDGRAAIAFNAPPTLATAGAGDVLAGFVLALLAQGMDAFRAACAAVWVHGACADRFGPGLIAEDLSEQVPAVLRDLAVRAGG